MTERARLDVETTRKQGIKSGTKSRAYMLGSFFATLLTAITDPKDGNALGIKTDPAYNSDCFFSVRKETATTWR